MRKKIIFFFYLSLFSSIFGYGQIRESFSDGDFTNDPAWVGSTTDFIVNAALQLQSNNTVANSTFYLSTANQLANATQWEFWVRLAFNPSSANYVDAYLTASSANLSSASTSGYFVRIGNTDDEICLYRKQSNGSVTKIIDGVNGILNTSNNVMKIKVIRNVNDEWTLFRDLSGTGNNYVSEGKVIDSTFKTSAYFGFLIKQSTASFFQRHFFDDIEVSSYEPDISPPKILSAFAITATTVDVLFNEPVDPVSSQEASNYSANNGLGMPVSAILDSRNPALAHLTFSAPFANGYAYTLTCSNVKDLAGNAMDNEAASFSFYTPQQYDIVIDELFPDPNPQIGLPLFKFLELKNVSSFQINLSGWKLIDGASTATLPSYNLKPDSFVIVCATNSVSFYTAFGPVIGVTNFPSMNIGGATIVLKSSTGKTIHAVQYDLSFYKNQLKKEGGWSLEMIDTKKPCIGFDNWKASVDPSGGTPGRKNSVDGIKKDEAPPNLVGAFAVSPNLVRLLFDKSLDSLKAASAANYTFDNHLSAISAEVLSPFYNRVNLTLNKSMDPEIIYSVTAKELLDCSGNPIAQKNTARFAISQDADSLDLVINEILFNPFPQGAEFVEIYNRSSKVIDLSKISIANRNSANAISNIKTLTTESKLLFPKEFMVLTSDPATVKSQYITLAPEAFLQLASMPSLPNDKGTAIILNGQGDIIDEVRYSEKWHFPLIHNPKGVSLERIDYEGTSTQSNFHSAATSVGYGTPGYKNSQFRIDEQLRGDITVTPAIFSPDNDGIDDFVTIDYNFPTAGYVTNITVFDASGRIIRLLQKNSLSGIKGSYRWDGLDDKSRQLPQGIYIIYTEVFNKDGKKKQFKNTVVLARRK